MNCILFCIYVHEEEDKSIYIIEAQYYKREKRTRGFCLHSLSSQDSHTHTHTHALYFPKGAINDNTIYVLYIPMGYLSAISLYSVCTNYSKSYVFRILAIFKCFFFLILNMFSRLSKPKLITFQTLSEMQSFLHKVIKKAFHL